MQLQIQKRLVGGGVVRAHLFPSGESVSKLLGGWAGCSQRFHQGDSVASPSLPARTRSLTEKFPCGALQADAMAGMTHLLFLMVSTHRSSWKCLPKRASLVH